MKILAAFIVSLSLTLAAGTVAFADTNLDAPDTLQKNQGPGNMDATAPDLKKKAAAVAAPAATPKPTPAPKVPKAPKVPEKINSGGY